MAACADDLRQEMARIRAGARGKAFLLKHETKQLLDWKQFLDWKRYVRLYPWAILGSALLAGYFLVPTRRSAPREVVPEGRGPARRREFAANAAPSQETVETVKKAGVLTALLGFAGTVLYRAGLNYATRKLVEGFLAPRTAASAAQQEKTYEFRRATYP